MNSLRTQRKVFKFVFLSVIFSLLILFAIIPILFLLFYSFTDFSGLGTYQFIGLKNYIDFLSSDFISLFKNNIYYLASGIIQVAIALYLAINMYFTKKFKSLKLFIIIFPYLINTVCLALIFIDFFKVEGILNTLLNTQYNFLSSHDSVNIVMGFISYFKYMPISFLVFYYSFLTIDRSIIEAAQVDGASMFNLFKNIFMPNSLSALNITIIMLLTASLTAFEIPYLIKGNVESTNTFMIYIIEGAFINREFASACAASVLISLVILLIVITTRRIINENNK